MQAGPDPGLTLNPDAFFTGTAAPGAGDRIIYDSTTGAFYYDAGAVAVGVVP